MEKTIIHITINGKLDGETAPNTLTNEIRGALASRISDDESTIVNLSGNRLFIQALLPDAKSIANIKGFLNRVLDDKFYVESASVTFDLGL